MRIRWTPAAAADLQHISTYLKDRHPRYQQPTMRKLYETIQSLKEWPRRGRLGCEDGTRELLFPPLSYIAVYRVREQDIEVLIYHAAQGRILIGLAGITERSRSGVESIVPPFEKAKDGATSVGPFYCLSQYFCSGCFRNLNHCNQLRVHTKFGS